MEYSTKMIKVILPVNQDRKKIICEIDSHYTQIGNNNKAFISASDRGADGIPSITKINLEDVVGSNESEYPSEIAIVGRIVQVVPRDEAWPDYMDIAVKSARQDSTVQIGHKAKLQFHHDGPKVEVGDRRPKLRLAGGKKRQNNKKRENEAKTTARKYPSHAPSVESRGLYNKFFTEVLAVLHPLRDDGEWDRFDEKLNLFRVTYGSDPVWDILLTLEQGQQICYHSFESNIDEAENILFQGLKTLECLKDLDPSIRQLCQGRAYCYLASVYRRKKLFGKAEKCLEIAERCLKNTMFLYDEASVNYEKASLYLVFDQKGSYVRQIKLCLDRCSDLCAQINKDRKWEFVKKGHFAKLKKAMLLLDCSTKPGRKRRISNEYLKEAQKCLEELENENLTCQEVPVSEQLQCMLAKSDRAFRSQCYLEAKEIAEEAISLAKKYGFDENPALKRLQDIESTIRHEPASERTLFNDEAGAQWFSDDADVSATAEDTD